MSEEKKVRENGYYWVKRPGIGEWIIADFDDGEWFTDLFHEKRDNFWRKI